MLPKDKMVIRLKKERKKKRDPFNDQFSWLPSGLGTFFTQFYR